MSEAAQDCLTVFVDGTEKPGVIIYALSSPGLLSQSDFPSHLWPDASWKAFKLEGAGWEVRGWDVAIEVWPRGEQWERRLRATFSVLVGAGARVSWLGAEGAPFSDPPDLLSADTMSGGVFAAMTSAFDFFCALDPDTPPETISNEEMLVLRRHAKGLADAEA